MDYKMQMLFLEAKASLQNNQNNHANPGVIRFIHEQFY